MVLKMDRSKLGQYPQLQNFMIHTAPIRNNLSVLPHGIQRTDYNQFGMLGSILMKISSCLLVRTTQSDFGKFLSSQIGHL